MDELLASVAVEDVWGIGKRSALLLQQQGIITAKALRDADHVRIRQRLNVLAQRAVLELQGILQCPLSASPLRRRAAQTVRGP